MTQVFISYKSEYRHLAERVRDHLQRWGYETWFDHEDIPSGAYFRHEIQKGLEDSEIVVGLMTREAFDSREVMWEWDYAIYNSRFIGLKYDDVPLPYHLAGTQYIDCTQDEAQAFKALQLALTVSPQPQPAPVPRQPTKQAQRLQQQDGNRLRMLNKVRRYWIDGVLEPSLRVGTIDLSLALEPEVVLRHHDYGEYTLDKSAGIVDVFVDMQRELLILGAPGAGKTTMMLQLARHLIDLAQKDAKQPIPVVLNLSSWAVKCSALDVWIMDRLYLEYQSPLELARLWVENAELIPLLDGLDEVGIKYRDACVEAINTFRREYPFVDMVVCSRIEEYEHLTNRLDLRGAVLLQPMSAVQIDAYLRPAELAGVRELVVRDPVIREMAQTPFLLGALATAYYNQSAAGLDGYRTLTERRDHLFEHYLRERFDSGYGYTLKATHHYLTWLARQLTAHEQIIFYIENLQPSWLTEQQQRDYRLVRWLVAGLLVGGLMILSVLLRFQLRGITLSLMVGGLGGLLLVRYGGVRYMEVLNWSWRGAVISGGVGLMLGALTTLGALGLQIIGTPQDELIPLLISQLPVQARPIFNGTLLGMVVGAIFSALLGGLFFSNPQIEIRTRPNQGIWRSTINAASIGLALGLTIGITVGIGFNWLAGGVFLGLQVALAAFLTFGGVAVIKHRLLRLVLERAGVIPTNYAEFLDFAAHTGILRKVGGGYIFVHRYLLDFFAESSVLSEKTSP